MKKQPRPEQYAEHQQNMLDDSLLPEEERFDWQTTKALCVGDVHKHQAYGMGFEDYLKNRRSYMDTDDTERHRLSFYLPKFHSMLTVDIAGVLGISTHRFLVTIMEIGLINFQVDYHNQYQIAKAHRKSMVACLITEHARKVYMQMDKQTIALGSATGSRCGGSKHFSPSVPLWLYDALTEVAGNLNMSISDMAHLVWCIGTSKTLPSTCLCPMLEKDTQDIQEQFIFELDMYIRRIQTIKSIFKDDD